MGNTDEVLEQLVDRAFGAENRQRHIARYFEERGSLTAGDAWQHVYRLLLWIDRTTGLAHCYESDKSQPGRPWYGRTLAFHDWVSRNLGVEPGELAREIDTLFRRAVDDLAATLRYRRVATGRVLEQRAHYEGRGFPEPGEDLELSAIIEEALRPYFAEPPPLDVWKMLVRRIQEHAKRENKRKNLVGEGFEDVLASIIGRSPAAGNVNVFVRRLLEELPGFRGVSEGEKPKKVDLAVVHGNQQRTLVTAKWSVRSDREEQFEPDLEIYTRANIRSRPFNYVLVTNEFDPARLRRACEDLKGNSLMFTHVVHINPAALLATYGDAPKHSAAHVVEHITQGRLISLEAWLELLGRE